MNDSSVITSLVQILLKWLLLTRGHSVLKKVSCDYATDTLTPRFENRARLLAKVMIRPAKPVGAGRTKDVKVHGIFKGDCAMRNLGWDN